MDRARDEGDRARQLADTVRAVADTDRGIADHERIIGDRARDDSTTSAITDLSATISELGQILVAMETERSQNVRDLKRSFRSQRWVLRILAAGVVVFVVAVLALGRLVYGQSTTNQEHIDCLAAALIGRTPPACTEVIGDLRSRGILPMPTTTTTITR